MILFYDFLINIFIILSIISSIFVIISKNPLHSIIYLILVFCNIVFLLLLQEIEFLAMIFLIVYIGAIAVLFLFVIYMLNIKIIELNELNWQYLIGIFLSFFIFLILCLIIFWNQFNNNILFIENNNNIDYINWFIFLYNINGLMLLSYLLYFNNYVLFILISIILLIAMIGSIVLTSKKTFFLKEQNIFEQNKRFIKKKYE